MAAAVYARASAVILEKSAWRSAIDRTKQYSNCLARQAWVNSMPFPGKARSTAGTMELALKITK